MLTMSSYLHEYMVENAKFFNEFDRSSFIANASLALNDKVVDLSLSVKGNQYSHILEKSISHVHEITIDTYAVSEFVSKILGSAKVDAANLNIQDISKADSIYLKPQYLTEAVLSYKEVINNIATGKLTSDDVKSLCGSVDTYIDTLKKRAVSTTAVIEYNPKSLLKHAFLQQSTKVTTKYLEDIVLPFLQEVPKKKKDLITELTIVNSSVCSTVADLKKLTEDITIAISTNKVDDAKKKLLLNYSYNYIRAIMEVVSYLTYAVIKKVHQFEESVVVCQNLYNSLTLLFNGVSTVVEAGVFDKKVITATDANNMVEKLVDGDNDVFVELAHNIMQYHKGYLATHMDDTADISGTDTESYLSTVLSKNEYNREIYNDLVKAYIEIGNGLDIIAKNCDDRLAIFDELVKKSGFVVMLHDRFHNEIEALEDLSKYGITDLEIGDHNQKTDTYFTILAEINDYPEITEQIAKAAKVIYTKAEYVEDLFNHKKNGELAYSETMNELKIFLDSFKDQYRKFNSDIVTSLYYRLKALAAKADECLDNVYSTPESDIYTPDDFFREAVLADIDEMNGINDVIMEVLLKEYYAEREFKERGVRLVYEAEGDNTAVKITDNSTETSGNAKNTTATKANVNNLVNSIGEWFTKMINSFLEIIGREKAKNLKWLTENKEGLTSRSYSNVEIQILPYDRMPSTTVVNDITKLTNNVKAMTVQNIQNIGSVEALRSKLINFGPKFKADDDKVAITNYYKVGNNPAQTVPYANNNIKTMVVNEMIPYCENFYDSYSEGIKKQLTALKDAMAEISKTYVTESVNCVDDLLVFIEAEQPAQTTTTTQTTPNTENTTNVASKAKWMKDCIQGFSGSVLNAIRDRKNDYFKVLFALAPKAKPVAEPTATEPTQTPTEEPATK